MKIYDEGLDKFFHCVKLYVGRTKTIVLHIEETKYN